MSDNVRKPTVIIPYDSDDGDTSYRDIFVYLRPESNGVVVESSLLRVIERSPIYRSYIDLVYLANVPGEYITANRIIENHYSYKLPFAKEGKRHFTQEMQRQFTIHFGVDFEEATILGAFDSLEILSMTPEELFGVWVRPEDYISINCQTIKRIDDLFVVNYDIPALFGKYTVGTDIAVMIFRSKLEHADFHSLIDDMEAALRSEGVIDERTAASRAFHHSGSPFDQLLDARGHLFTPEGEQFDVKNIQFCRYLRSRGIHCREIEKALHFPIMQFKTAEGTIIEDCLYGYTRDDDYETACSKFQSAVSQFIIR